MTDDFFQSVRDDEYLSGLAAPDYERTHARSIIRRLSEELMLPLAALVQRNTTRGMTDAAVLTKNLMIYTPYRPLVMTPISSVLPADATVSAFAPDHRIFLPSAHIVSAGVTVYPVEMAAWSGGKHSEWVWHIAPPKTTTRAWTAGANAVYKPTATMINAFARLHPRVPPRLLLVRLPKPDIVNGDDFVVGFLTGAYTLRPAAR